MMIEDDDGFFVCFRIFLEGIFLNLSRSARIEPRLCIQMRLDERMLIHQASSKKDEIEGDS